MAQWRFEYYPNPTMIHGFAIPSHCSAPSFQDCFKNIVKSAVPTICSNSRLSEEWRADSVEENTAVAGAHDNKIIQGIQKIAHG